MSSTRDYTRAEISDTTTNVPLLSEDSWEDGPSDPALLIKDTVEDHPSVRFSVSSAGNGSSFNSPCKLTKNTVLVAIIAVLIVICIVLSALLSRYAGKSGTIEQGKRKPLHQNTVCVTQGCIDAAHHMFHALNRSVHPCDDFYEYACGGWLQNHPIPESKSFWGIYSALQEDNERLLRQLLAAPTRSPTIKKAKTFYNSCMNLTNINKMGAKPLRDIIEDLGGWSITSPDRNKTKFDFGKTLRLVHKKYSGSAFFAVDVDADDKNSSKNIIKVDQAGLTLSRTYYLNNMTDPKLVAYLNYMTTIGVLLGGKENETRKQMREVLEFEIKLAKIFVPHENRSQIDEIYNKTNIKNLTELCPQIGWLAFLKNHFKNIADIKDEEEVVVYATRYLAALSPVIKNASERLLNNYLVWHVVDPLAPLLSEKFRDAHEDLIKVLTGSTRSEDLWKKCMGSTGGAIGMAVGKLFVEKVFDGTSKQQATQMVDAVRDAFKRGLPDLEWMDEKTRKAAEDKADAVVDMIGFPDYIKDPQKLEEKYKG
ncbi:Endothelin-converting enzyme 2, partial [Stylophora pistillata]